MDPTSWPCNLDLSFYRKLTDVQLLRWAKLGLNPRRVDVTKCDRLTGGGLGVSSVIDLFCVLCVMLCVWCVMCYVLSLMLCTLEQLRFSVA